MWAPSRTLEACTLRQSVKERYQRKCADREMFSCLPFCKFSAAKWPANTFFSFSLAQVHLQDLHWSWATLLGRLHQSLPQYVLQINSMCCVWGGDSYAQMTCRILECSSWEPLLFIKSNNYFMSQMRWGIVLREPKWFVRRLRAGARAVLEMLAPGVGHCSTSCYNQISKLGLTFLNVNELQST